MTPGWTVGADIGALWVTTEELVEGVARYAAEHLCRLTWQAPAGVAGVRVSYRSGECMRMNGGVWYVEDAGGGELVNLDYLDATSEAVTHRSVSPAIWCSTKSLMSGHVRLRCATALAFASATACLMTSCEGAQGMVDPSAKFSLEVVNDATAAVRVQIMMGGWFPFSTEPQGHSGILDLDSGARPVFRLSSFGAKDSESDNRGVHGFRGILFYRRRADIPYVGYTYQYGECAYAYARSIVGDSTLCLYDITGAWWRYDYPGTIEQLFVESPDRPFYLELDQGRS